MRRCKRLIVIVILMMPACIKAQPKKLKDIDITGLWKGTLYNDSTKLNYRYEIGIGYDRGKLTGFSHTWFILDDKQFFGVKKVKVSIRDEKVIVQDDGLISHNYPVDPAKRVYQLNVLDLVIKDSLMLLQGPFTTNRTKNYAPLTGTVTLQRKNDYWQSSLVPHLQELGKATQLSFVSDSILLAQNNDAVALQETLESTLEPTITAPARTTVAVTDIKTNPEQSNNPTGTPQIGQYADITPPPVIPDKTNLLVEAAAEIDKRTTVAQQLVYFKSDSLQLSLYDNGEVDGDIVSVLLNGQLILARQKLSTNAIRKTIYIDPLTDSIQLLMYAENLGTIAPNTGLLVIKDGKDIVEVRFSGDLQKNAAVIFKRKKK